MYLNFDYQKPRPFFHTFEANDAIVGFSFADESEAEKFYQKVVQSRRTGSSSNLSNASSSSFSSSSYSGSSYSGSSASYTKPIAASAPSMYQ
jgi:Wiskott-Aldrich syndrome protein